MTPTAEEIAAYLDEVLGVGGFPDYPNALNGLQLSNRGPIRRVAAAVDFSMSTIDAATTAGANFLILHHGMYWSGLQRLVGLPLDRLRKLIENDVAVYAAHLPLDASESVGNCALLARELTLTPSARFGEYHGVPIGVAGDTDLPTSELLDRATAFSMRYGGSARASSFSSERRTKRWAVITGSGADSSILRTALDQGIDTLITGEGPHHTTVDAPDLGLVVIYCGHYASETLGVRALAGLIAERFRIPSEFLPLPTGS